MGAVNLAQACVSRTAVTTGLDDAIFTTHWGGPGSGPMDHATRVTATNALKAFWSDVGAFLHVSHVLREVKWYDVSSSAPYRTSFIESIATGAAPGTPAASTGGLLPPQNAISVTLKTNLRKHWGRFYLPGITFTQIDSTRLGALKSTTCDAIATSAATLCQQATGPTVIVWNGQAGTAAFIDHVQVDDVVDVIRRRRMKVATYKKALPV